ncbi:MAG: DUF503 family protein [Candidatus Bipolaricaulia bacterium]
MKAGLLTLSFRLYAVDTLKARRSIVKRILADVHRLGPAFAVCEIPDQAGLSHLTIRVAHVSADARFTDSALRRAADRFEHKADYEVAESAIEIL